MALDENTYGFNRTDAEELIGVIGGEETTTPLRQPRGGGRSSLAQGTLTDLDDGTGDYTGKQVGTVTVVVAPCGRSSLLGTSVEVVDWSGCVFDHAFEDLDGVWVWFGEGIAESLDPEASEGQLTPCHWVAHDRCCVAADTGA